MSILNLLNSSARTSELNGHIVDDNLNNIRWWTDKHNKYADREMIDILDKKYKLFLHDDALKVDDEQSQAKLKRMVKEGVHNKLPIFVRLGFLDGMRGFAFHFFQGYWYRSLVDLRVYALSILLKAQLITKKGLVVLKFLPDLSFDEDSFI
jgi:hypothetical protein